MDRSGSRVHFDKFRAGHQGQDTSGEDQGDGEVRESRSAQSSRRRHSEKDLGKMSPHTRSKIMAYEEPPKEILDRQRDAKQRIADRYKREMLNNQVLSEEERREREQHEKLIGQLKAAEARNRIRIMRLRHHADRSSELNHLIACQPTAAMAVRLEALVPTKEEKRSHNSQHPKIDKISRERIERLLCDDLGTITKRS